MIHAYQIPYDLGLVKFVLPNWSTDSVALLFLWNLFHLLRNALFFEIKMSWCKFTELVSNDDALILCHGTFILMLLPSVAHEEHGGLVYVLAIVILAQVAEAH